MGEVGTDAIKTIVITLTVFSAEEDITTDLYDLYMDTIVFDDTIPSVVRLSVTGENTMLSLPIVCNPSSATLVASSNSTEIATFTKSTTGDNYEIKAVKAGSCIVKVVASATDYANNQREIKVIVE